VPILLLCGYGYLGEAISREFRAADWEVVALSLSGGDGTIACDVSSRDAVKGLEVRPDFIVHCAASGRGGAEAYRAVYLEGCRNLIGAFPGVGLLFTSSTSVYAQTDGSVVTEESAAEPERETGKILREAEEVVLASGGIVGRLAGIYGPGRSALNRLRAGRAQRVVKEGQVFSRIHVDDLATVLRTAMARGQAGRAYNVADDAPAPPQDVIAHAAELLGMAPPPEVPFEAAGLSPMARSFYAESKRVSNRRIKEELGVTLAYPSYREGLRAVLAAGG
jgi:nucleoside-diphosphate-sugar epimerase